MEPPTRVRYEGSPLFAGTLGRLLEEHGVEVRFDPDVQGRPGVDGATGVTVHYLCRGSLAAIDVAVQRFLEHCEPDTTVEVLPEPAGEAGTSHGTRPSGQDPDGARA